MTIAVTTASGQLGSAVVAAVVAKVGAHNVVGLARTPEKAEHLGVEVRPGDYDNREQLTASLRGVDTLLLVSGISAPSERIGQHPQRHRCGGGERCAQDRVHRHPRPRNRHTLLARRTGES